jgi:hypothetical protein
VTHSRAGDPQYVKRRIELRKTEIRDFISGYLAECPNAMDTLEGIAGFWLTRQSVRAQIALLTEVLEELVAEGYLETVGEGENRHYRLREPPARNDEP